MDGRRFLESLKYVLMACPKAKENETLSRVIFTDNRIIAGDSYRWHIAYLPHDVKLKPIVTTRAAVEKLRRMLNGVVPPKTSEERATVTMDGRIVTVRDDDEPMERTLEAWQSGVWPKGFEPPVPKDGAPIAGPPPGFDSKHVHQACSWKDTTAVWIGSVAGGPVRVDTMIGDERIATAVILPAGEHVDVADDPRQGTLIPPNTQPLSESAVGKAPVVPQKPAPARPEGAKPRKGGKGVAAKLEPSWRVERRDHGMAAVTMTTGDEDACAKAFAKEVGLLERGDDVWLYKPDGTVAKHQHGGPAAKGGGAKAKANGKGKHKPEARA